MRRLWILLIIVIAALPAGCDLFVDDNVAPIEGRYCSVPETLSETVESVHTGALNYCSSEWETALGFAKCVSRNQCERAGLTCVKTPGGRTYECRTLCGQEGSCGAGGWCLQCEDTLPHCKDMYERCPTPLFVDTDADDTDADDTEDNTSCVGDGTCSATANHCCAQESGLPRICISKQSQAAGGTNPVTYDCMRACETSSDCPAGGCCLLYSVASGKVAWGVVDAPESSKICFDADSYYCSGE